MGNEENESEESVLPEGVEDQLRAKYGKLITFEDEALGPFAFKRASQPVYDKLVNQLTDSKDKSQAIRSFALQCLVWPAGENEKPNYAAGRALFEAMPGAAPELAEAIQELPGKLNLKKR